MMMGKKWIWPSGFVCVSCKNKQVHEQPQSASCSKHKPKEACVHCKGEPKFAGQVRASE